jgi:hypothetical protein
LRAWIAPSCAVAAAGLRRNERGARRVDADRAVGMRALRDPNGGLPMSIRPRALAWLLAAACCAGHGVLAHCPPADPGRDSLLALKAAGFALPDDARRQHLARELVACLGDPDPLLRDGIAFEAYTAWLRSGALDLATRTHLLDALLPMLTTREPDDPGFRAPFAALVLSEVARTDRIEPWLSPAQRAALLDAATGYLRSLRDYRGFDPQSGWRHGVAHAADLLLQLALNPALDKAALDRILAAVAVQIAPPGEHAYVDGESERLARPVLFIAQRALHTDAEWKAWFEALVAPAPLASWQDAYTSREGLAKRHNVLMFLRTAYVGAREGGDAKFEVLVPHLVAAMKAVP